MIETIDKRGLRKQFLTKHVPEVERFFRWLVAEKFDSQTAQGYQKRFVKNREKLFTFLAHDGVIGITTTQRMQSGPLLNCGE